MFANRVEAGRRLAGILGHLRAERPIVYGLPRGGVVVAAEVAAGLSAPLDVVLVRKIGAPDQPELALGAVVDGAVPVTVWNEDIVKSLRISVAGRTRLEARQMAVLAERRALYAGHRPDLSPAGRTTVLVDDGLATGATALAAIEALRRAGAGRIVLAVPVAPDDALDRFERAADEVVVVERARRFPGVGAFYDDFAQTSDEEVIACLERQRAWLGRSE